jgi:hypothetical protein
MSQLNLKQILSGDNVSTIVDKLNYNFDQIILNGGGPQGLRGILGSPGLPGAQGLQGATGPIGEHGTYIFAEHGLTPGDYPFGTGGGPSPRDGDVYLETNPVYLNVWELGATGWNLVESISIPSGSFNTVVDNGFTSINPFSGPATTYVVNDINIAEKVFFGSSASFNNHYLLSPGSNELLADISVDVNDAYIAELTVASDSNQLRLLSGHAGDIGTNIAQDGGGILHSLEVFSFPVLGDDVQMYRIVNGDSDGNKYFTLNLNGTLAPAFVADTSNNTGIGIDISTVEIDARLNVDSSLIVGSSSYYGIGNHVLLNGMGILSEGNLGVGVKDNSFATGAFLGATFGSIWIDTYTSQGSDLPNYSLLRIGSDIFYGQGNTWDFRHDANSFFQNKSFGSLTLSSQYYNLGTLGTQTANAMYFSLTGGTNFTVQTIRPSIGVANTDPISLFEVGAGQNRITLGEMGGGGSSYDGSNYIGFNLHRSPVTDSWIRRGDGAYNSGKVIWTGIQDTGMHFTFIPSTSGITASAITDAEVTSNTRASILSNGAFWNSPNKNALEGLTDPLLGLYVGFGATGATGDLQFGSTPNPSRQYYRRPNAFFGDWNTISSPVIFSTAGLTQSLTVSGRTGVDIVPQYSFYGADTTGFYISDKISVNTQSFQYDSAAVGIATMGIAGVHVGGNSSSGARVGIGTRTPYERLQVGEMLTYHDSVNSTDDAFIGYNLFKDSSINAIKRIAGSTAVGAIRKGYTRISYPTMDLTDTQIGSLSRFTSPGTKFTLAVGHLGGTAENVINSEYDANYKNYRGVMIAPPAIGGIDFINLAEKVPQMSIGIPLDTFNVSSALGSDSAVSGKRGTLSIAAQMRMKPNPSGPFGMTTEDYYNVGLYSYDGYPVAAIQAAGGNPSSYTTKSLNWNFIGASGDAIFQDISVLYAETDIDLTNKFQRRSYFGDSFRVGVNVVPNFINTPLSLSTYTSGDGHDTASFNVAGATAYYQSNQVYHPAAILKGSVIIDQTPFDSIGDGGGNALWFKDGAITGGLSQVISGGIGNRTSPLATNTYAGDWGISYKKVSAGGSNYDRGLSFFKPSLTSTPLFISDSGNVGIGLSNTNIAFNFSISPSTAAVSHSGASTSWNNSIVSGTAKLNVSGNILCSAIITSSDSRLKTSINSLDSTIEKIKLLNPVDYEFIDAPGISNKGFIAQEILQIYPEVVRIFDDKEFEGGKLSLDYNSFIPILTKGIQEQQEIIEKQAETIKNLEAKLSKIEELLERNNIS